MGCCVVSGTKTSGGGSTGRQHRQTASAEPSRYTRLPESAVPRMTNHVSVLGGAHAQQQQQQQQSQQSQQPYHRGEPYGDAEALSLAANMEQIPLPRYSSSTPVPPPAAGYYAAPAATASSPAYPGFSSHAGKLFASSTNVNPALNSSSGGGPSNPGPAAASASASIAQQTYNTQYAPPMFTQSSYASSYSPQFGSHNAWEKPQPPHSGGTYLPPYPSSSSAAAAIPDDSSNPSLSSRYDHISNSLSDLARITLEIEPLVSSSTSPATIPKDLVLKGLENLQHLQHVYSDWLKYLNINNTQSFNKIEKQAVRTLSLMNNFENEQANDDDTAAVLEPGSKKMKASPHMMPDSTSSMSLSLTSPVFTAKQGEERSSRLPKRISSSGISNSKINSSLSSASSLDLGTFPMSTSAPPMGGSAASGPLSGNNASAGNSYGYGFGYGYQQYHYQQYQYQPSLQILHENSSTTSYDKESITRPKLLISESINQHSKSNNISDVRGDGMADPADLITIHVASMECMHCSSKGTPEWRRGPGGERTLCNACGLFYSKLVKKYGENDAKAIMANRKKMGKSMDRRLSIT